MGLSYDPKDATKVFPVGDYEAELLQVQQQVSSKGNDMEKWTIKVYNDEGKSLTLSEYVVVPGATFKIKQLAAALGKQAAFNDGTFQAEDHEGATFKVTLAIEESDGDFPDKNKVKKYLPAQAAPPPPQRPTSMKQDLRARQPVPANPISDKQEFKSDDIPF